MIDTVNILYKLLAQVLLKLSLLWIDWLTSALPILFYLPGFHFALRNSYQHSVIGLHIIYWLIVPSHGRGGRIVIY